MLPELVKERMKKEELSTRQAASQIGIAHTTVARIIGGEQIDLSTYIKVCEWLHINPADVLKTEGRIGSVSELASSIASIIFLSPSLEPVFLEIVRRFEAGEVSSDTLQDLIKYAAFRLGVDTLGS